MLCWNQFRKAWTNEFIVRGKAAKSKTDVACTPVNKVMPGKFLLPKPGITSPGCLDNTSRSTFAIFGAQDPVDQLKLYCFQMPWLWLWLLNRSSFPKSQTYQLGLVLDDKSTAKSAFDRSLEHSFQVDNSQVGIRNCMEDRAAYGKVTKRLT